jgi:hypothetical protein
VDVKVNVAALASLLTPKEKAKAMPTEALATLW